jgi:hypothetical protein
MSYRERLADLLNEDDETPDIDTEESAVEVCDAWGNVLAIGDEVMRLFPPSYRETLAGVLGDDDGD